MADTWQEEEEEEEEDVVRDSDEGEVMEEDVQGDSETEDVVSDSGSKRLKLEASPLSYVDLLPFYGALDDFLIKQDKGRPNFTYSYSMWSEEPDVDRQYKTLYDKLMDIPNFYKQVCEEVKIRGDDCPCLLQAIQVADDDQFCYLDEGSVVTCLQDMLKEHQLAKELDKLKEYEKCLVDSKYWKNKEGESAPVELEEYKPYTGFCFTGFSLADVKKDFESWLFKLGSSVTEEELQKRVQDAHANRVNISKGFMQTRARYIGKKLEHWRREVEEVW